MIELDHYPNGPIRGTNNSAIVGSAFVTIEPNLTEFKWDLRNEIRDLRWSTLVWLLGERFTLELSDLDNAILSIKTYLSHGEG